MPHPFWEFRKDASSVRAQRARYHPVPSVALSDGSAFSYTVGLLLSKRRVVGAHSGQGHHPVPSGGSFRRLSGILHTVGLLEQERSHLQRDSNTGWRRLLCRGGGEFLHFTVDTIRRSCARLKWWIRYGRNDIQPASSRQAEQLGFGGGRRGFSQSEPG